LLPQQYLLLLVVARPARVGSLLLLQQVLLTPLRAAPLTVTHVLLMGMRMPVLLLFLLLLLLLGLKVLQLIVLLLVLLL
jgi:hypothetical protein